jgi:hypothetical protein
MARVDHEKDQGAKAGQVVLSLFRVFLEEVAQKKFQWLSQAE